MRQLKIATAAGLALVIAAGTAVVAQAPRSGAQPPAAGDSARQDRRGERGPGERGPGGRRSGGPEGMLLRGITLTDAQKQQLATLRPTQGAPDEAARERARTAMSEARAARERGDTATANARLAQLRTQREQERARHVAAVRGILTAEQRATFDKNVAEMQQRQQARGERGDRGPRGERGGRGERGERGPRGAEHGADRDGARR